MINLRRVYPSVLLSVVCAGAGLPARADLPAAPLADGHIKFFGGVYSSPQAPNLASYFNQVTPENAGKWASVEGTRDVMNWDEADAAYNLAKSNGFVFRYHVLVWGSQQPGWIATLPATEQLAEIEEWFNAVAARYPAIDYLEVVNEPISQPPDDPEHGNYINALGGTGATGWDWVLTAFRMARRIFPPTTKLMLNEYSITNDTTRMNRYIQIVNLLKAEGLIDAVGVQAHYFSTKSYSGNLPGTSAQTKANLDLLAATGVPIIATEMDIDGGTLTTTNDELQLSEYQRIFPIFWQHPGVVGVTLWGYRPGLWRNNEKAYLVLEDGTERPAMQWLRSYLTTGAPSIATQPVSQTATVGGSVVLTMAATGTPTPTLSWQRNGGTVAGATSATLTLANVQPADTGIYTGVALGGTAGTAAAYSNPAIVGLQSSTKIIGAGTEVLSNQYVQKSNNTYDQILLGAGGAVAIKADYSPDPAQNQITRTSFVDLDGDIVQVEYSGPGTLSLVLETPTGPATPEKYDQPTVQYMKGQAGIVITGATRDSHLTVFTVGRSTAVNQALFKDSVTYDGIADIAYVAIASADGKFGGVRTANTNYFASRGYVGVYAPGVEFTGPVFIGDICAYDSAQPVVLLGGSTDVRITGGNMTQGNGKPVQVSGITQLKFTAGTDSHGNELPAQRNRAVYSQNGADVTAQIVVNPVN